MPAFFFAAPTSQMESIQLTAIASRTDECYKFKTELHQKHTQRKIEFILTVLALAGPQQKELDEIKDAIK